MVGFGGPAFCLPWLFLPVTEYTPQGDIVLLEPGKEKPKEKNDKWVPLGAHLEEGGLWCGCSMLGESLIPLLEKVG